MPRAADRPRDRNLIPMLLGGVALMAAVMTARAGDSVGVTEALHGFKGNWPEAQFSIDATGFIQGDAVLDHSIQVEFEAALPGFVSYLQISSHGDMTLVRGGEGAAALGTISVPVQPPIGPERTIVFYSDRPLDEVLPAGHGNASLGADRGHAEAFLQQLSASQGRGLRLASRSLNYLVNAPEGETQYTTRSIIREVEHAPSHASGTAAPRFPTRIEFEFDSDQLTAKGKRDLDVFGAALVGKLRNRPLTLEGHTDAIGTDAYNQQLSERRATAARQYLVDSFNLTPGSIHVTGKGKAGAVAPNDSEVDRSKNRRVDFIFESPPAR